MTASAAGRGERPGRWPPRRAVRTAAAGLAGRLGAGLLGAGLLVHGTQPALRAPQPAAVPAAVPAQGSASTLQARASEIARTISGDQARLASLGERYLRERADYLSEQAREAADREAAARTARREARLRADVVSAAVAAYVGAGSDGALSLILGGSAASLATGETYLSAAAGQLDAETARLQDVEHRLATESATAAAAAAAVGSALDSTRRDRSAVLGTLAADRRLLQAVRGQLAALVQQELVARERAAALAAARAAAARAAARDRSAVLGTLAADRRLLQAVRGQLAALVQQELVARERAAATSGPPPAPSTGASPPAGAGPPAPTGVPAASGGPLPPGNLAAEFAAIRNCESGDDYSLDTGNGYYGAYQFSLPTWQGLGGAGLPSSAPPAVQDALAYRLYQQDGWAPWPECSAILGL